MNQTQTRQPSDFIAWSLSLTYGVTTHHILGFQWVQWILPDLTDAWLLKAARNSTCFFGVCEWAEAEFTPKTGNIRSNYMRHPLKATAPHSESRASEEEEEEEKTSFNWQYTLRQFPRATARFWNPRFFTPESFYWRRLSFFHMLTGGKNSPIITTSLNFINHLPKTHQLTLRPTLTLTDKLIRLVSSWW